MAGTVPCELVREAVSARLDGEALPVPGDLLEAHLAACARCRAFARCAAGLQGRLRLELLDPLPDLAGEVLGRLGLPVEPPGPRGRRHRALRWMAAHLPVARS